MCGIGGILRTDGQPIPEEWLDLIDARIAWRGPDGHGRFRDRVEIDDPSAPPETGGKRIIEVAFVHRRLSIIDHEGGHQPMVSQRGRNDSEGLVAVVFNGCIYNHRQLRTSLESKGHTFASDHSDTEVLVHGWREWAEKLPRHLEGMYAFAIWDRARATLFLARDLFGEKPLYYRTVLHEGSKAPLWFSSVRSALVTSDEELGDRKRARTFVAGYLQSGTSWGDVTISVPNERVFTLAPAHQIKYNPAPVHVASSPLSVRSQDPPTIEQVEQLIDAAVESRLEADVPIGCFLSGGVDSSLIALCAARHRRNLRTFNVRMPDPRYDESEFAQRVAAQIGTRHHTLDACADPVADLLRLINHFGQPFGDSSILPTYWVSQATRQFTKVALSGDGGDELFLGYQRYAAARLLGRRYKLLTRIPQLLQHRAHPKSTRSKLARLGEMARDFQFIGIRAMESIFTQLEIRELTDGAIELPLPSDPATLLPSQLRRSIDQAAEEAADIDRARSYLYEKDDYLVQLRRIDILEYLPNDLLTKIDTASMLCGLEVRCPFLDHDLARAALSMPIEQLMPGGQRKGLLRQIARKYLPTDIVDRSKMGFAIPIGEWFRNDDLPKPGAGLRSFLLDHLNSSEPFGAIQLNRTPVLRLIDEHMLGKRDHSQKLFTLLTLSIWSRGQKRN